MKEFTRRDLTRFAAMAAIALDTGPALTAQTPPPPAGSDALQAARDSKRAATEELARFPLEISTEPAFIFKA
jgi:hypothetical protein